MSRYRIVETDNHGGDWPNESFVNLPPTTEEDAQKIANAINDVLCPNDIANRFWKVVPDDYELQPGFEP